MDIITTLIYGYRYARIGDNTIANRVEHSRNYFFGDPEDIKAKFNGEWSRKFYLMERVPDSTIPVIPCFDIELGQDYNEGVREGSPLYVPANVTGRNSSALPFFNQDSDRNTKFVVTVNRGVLFDREDIPLPVTISFREFLLKYYDYRGKIIDKII